LSVKNNVITLNYVILYYLFERIFVLFNRSRLMGFSNYSNVEDVISSKWLITFLEVKLKLNKAFSLFEKLNSL